MSCITLEELAIEFDNDVLSTALIYRDTAQAAKYQELKRLADDFFDKQGYDSDELELAVANYAMEWEDLIWE